MKNLVFTNEFGEKYDIPEDKAQEALNSGLTQLSADEVRQEEIEAKYGDQDLRAGALAFGNSLSLGLLNQGLVKSGLMSGQELKDIKDANPISSGAGDVLGVAAPALLTGGGAAAATKFPKLYQLASLTPSGAAAGLAARTGSKVAESVAKKIVGEGLEQTAKKAAALGAIEFGTAGAIEGAILSAGELISEEAIGDAEFTAEAIASRVGMGTIAGGGIGAGIGSLSGVIQRGLRKRDINKNVDLIKKNIKDPELQNVAIDEFKKGVLRDETAELLLKNSDNVEEDAKLLSKFLGEEVKLTEGMKTGSPLIQGQEATIAGMPTPGGQKLLADIEKVREQSEAAVKKLAQNAKPDEYELGREIKGTLINRIKEEAKPLSDIFEATDTMFAKADVSDFQRKINLTAIQKEPWYEIASKPVKSLVNDYFDRAASAKTFEQIKMLRQEVGSTLGDLARAKKMGTLGNQGPQLEAYQQLYGTFTRMEENALDKVAKKYFKSVPDLEKWSANYKQAKKEWSGLIKKFEPITEDLNLSKQGIGVGDFIKRLDDLDETKVAKRIGAMEDSESFAALKKDFGDVVDKKARFEVAKMIQGSTDATGQFNPKMFRNKVKGMAETKRKMIFGDDDAVVQAIERIAERTVTPREFNPSGTGFLSQIVEIFSPAFQIREAARYAAYKKGAQGYRKFLSRGIPEMIAAKQAAKQAELKVVSAAKGFFNSSRTFSGVVAQDLLSDAQVDRAKKTLEMFETEPDKFIDQFTVKSGDSATFLPKTTQAAQNRIMAAVSFLQSEFPKRQEYIVNDDYQAPRSEAIKFNNYLLAIEKPFKVLDRIKMGDVNTQQIEALKVVYPKMFAKLQQDLIINMPKKLTQPQRARLSLILNAKVSPLADPRNMALLQGQPAQTPQQSPTNKVPVSAAKNLNIAGRSQAGLDQVLNRRV